MQTAISLSSTTLQNVITQCVFKCFDLEKSVYEEMPDNEYDKIVHVIAA